MNQIPASNLNSVQLHQCKNCENEFTGNYCNICGQHWEGDAAPTTKSILFYHLYKFIKNTKEFIHTSKELLLRPGTVLREYRAGKKLKYYNPINYFLVVGSIAAFLTINFSPLDAEKALKSNMEIWGIQAMEEYSEEELASLTEQERAKYERHLKSKNMQLDMIVWMQKHFNLLMLLTVPIFALAVYLAFKKTGYTYSEQLLFNFHLFGFTTLMASPTIILADPLDSTNFYRWVTIPLFLGYFAWAFKDLYHISFLRGIWKIILVYLLYFIIMLGAGIVAGLTGGIIGLVIGILSKSMG